MESKATEPRRSDFSPSILRLIQTFHSFKEGIHAQTLMHGKHHRELLPVFANPFELGAGICSRFVLLTMPPAAQRSAVLSLAWRPDGTLLSSGTLSGDLVFWNYQYNTDSSLPCFSSIKTVKQQDCGLSIQRWSHQSNLMAMGTDKGTLSIWKSDERYFNYPMGTFDAHPARDPEEGPFKVITDVAFAPSDQKLLTVAGVAWGGTLDNFRQYPATAKDSAERAKIWDVSRIADSCSNGVTATTTPERILQGHGFDVRCGDWHPYLSLVCTGHKDGHIRLWDMRVATSVASIFSHKSTCCKCKWSQNGKYMISVSKDQQIVTHELSSMKVWKQFKGHPQGTNCLSGHPEIENLILSGGEDGSVKYWDLEGSLLPVMSLQAHDQPVYSIAFHPLGHLLATGASDRSIRFWSRPCPGDVQPLLPRRREDIQPNAGVTAEPETVIEQEIFDNSSKLVVNRSEWLTKRIKIGNISNINETLHTSILKKLKK
eukprot:GHVL01041587.1.p2 GENE.GHVL01041587.1~~GHVL01041587.1.p2  ORF type:complete len:486 (+),score=120.98 GHVL01041587.1:1031-2488(+)